MNDTVLNELKTVVEQAVQPVRATIARKRQMREELLSHLATVFEEEAERLGDERAALERARERFGDVRELSRRLQESVPRRDRLRSVFERLGHQRDESVWHLAARHLLVMFVMYAVAVLVALPIMLALEWRFDLGTVAGWHDVGTFLATALVLVPLVLVLLNVALSLVLARLLSKMGPALAGKRWGRISLAVLCGLVSPFVLSGAFAGAALVFILVARQATEQWRYQQAWA